MSLIPGASAIGRGFNILGTYSAKSLMPQIIALGPEDKTWEYPPTGIVYQVPENAQPTESTHTTGSSYVYNTVEQFQSHFSQKAGVKASYGAFSGQFDVAYQKTVNTDQSYYYGIYEADFTAWDLLLGDRSPDMQTSAFRNDPDVKNLPDTFTPQNQEQFFSMFRKWGTHLVDRVVVGGSLDYYEAVQTSYSSNQQSVSANITLEYKAVFTSGKAESKTQWDTLGKSWSNSRLVTVSATGGDNSILDALNPSYGDNHVGIFTQWSNAVMKNPSVIEYTLKPLTHLFSGNQAAAVSDALEAYTNGAILVFADTDYTPGTAPGGGNVSTGWGIIANGNVAVASPPVEPPPPHVVGPGQVAPVGGYQLALYDPHTYEPIMCHLYYQTYIGQTLKPNPSIYHAMMTDLNKVTQHGYVAAVSGFGIDLQNYPSQEFSNWLLSIGATMNLWKKFKGYDYKAGSCCYVVLGRQGQVQGHAIELLQAMYSPANWLEQPYLFNLNPSVLGLTYARTANKALGQRGYGSLVLPEGAGH